MHLLIPSSIHLLFFLFIDSFTKSINFFIDPLPSSLTLAFIISGYIADVSGSYDYSFYTAGCLEVCAGLISTLFYCIKSSKSKTKTTEIILDSKIIIYERETVL